MRIAELDRAFLKSEYKGSRAAMLAAGDYLTFQVATFERGRRHEPRRKAVQHRPGRARQVAH